MRARGLQPLNTADSFRLSLVEAAGTNVAALTESDAPAAQFEGTEINMAISRSNKLILVVWLQQ